VIDGRFPTCPHGHKVLIQKSMSCGVEWTSEVAPEKCRLCEPGNVLQSYIQHPWPSEEQP
jgi:hypothetical protein